MIFPLISEKSKNPSVHNEDALKTYKNFEKANKLGVFNSAIGVDLGGLGVAIYDFELTEIDYFTMGFSDCNSRVDELEKVKYSIEHHEDDLFADEDCTDDMFVNHEYETGEDLEMQA